VCKYGLLYLVAFAIPVLRVQLRFVNCINKRKKRRSVRRTERVQAYYNYKEVQCPKLS